jgi:hypothetical protein
MARETSDSVLRFVALAATLLVVAALSSCGDDDASDSTAPGAEAGQAGSEQSAACAGGIRTFGEEAGPEDRNTATTTVEGFLGAQADGDWGKACSLMAASTTENLKAFGSESVKSQRCTELLEAVTARVPAKTLAQADRIRVTDMRIDGERGFVLYAGASETESALPVVREGSTWKVGAIAGYRLP